MIASTKVRSAWLHACLMLCVAGIPVAAQDSLPGTRDRGTGVRTSIFGTYIRRGELLVHPFAEYYYANNQEYKPRDFGHADSTDYRGRFRATEGLMFIGYGFTDWLALELEGAVINATLDKSPSDPSAMPARTKESGPGDMQAQLDFRFLRETATRPEVFGFFETVFPSNRRRALIGTSDFEFKSGVGVIRGFRFGTLTARAAVQHSRAERTTELGEWAVEYLRRLSPRWRVYAGIEGVDDEIEAIGELQWHFGKRGFARFNSAAGLTSKTIDWAPDVGIVLSFPVR